jgi:phage shock protein PspC (stress-responsive transcriptional regulator)
MNTHRHLTRSNTDRIIAGVAGGIANYLDVDPTLVRLVFLLLVFAGTMSPWIYLVLWIILPGENFANQPFSQQVRENISEMEQRATQVAHQVSTL